MKSWMLLLIPAIAFSIGCSTVTMGTPIDKAKVEQIVPGTPEGKVVEVFGQPFKKEMVSADTTKYVYTYYEEQPRFFRKNLQVRETLEIYTKGGKVEKYDFKKEGID
jgi:outer membrane protein assembly factor BamE (lipoprotein component of BamABCDE complex)